MANVHHPQPATLPQAMNVPKSQGSPLSSPPVPPTVKIVPPPSSQVSISPVAAAPARSSVAPTSPPPRPTMAPASLPPRPSLVPASQPRLSGIRSAPPPIPTPRAGAEDSPDLEYVEVEDPDVEELVRAEVDAALAPLRDGLDDLERTVLATIVRLASRSSTASRPARSDATAQPNSASSGPAGQTGDQRRRQLILAFAVGILLGVVMLSGLLAASR
jgi:hypothetical protein